jgi:hypothetical protein
MAGVLAGRQKERAGSDLWVDSVVVEEALRRLVGCLLVVRSCLFSINHHAAAAYK